MLLSEKPQRAPFPMWPHSGLEALQVLQQLPAIAYQPGKLACMYPIPKHVAHISAAKLSSPTITN